MRGRFGWVVAFWGLLLALLALAGPLGFDVTIWTPLSLGLAAGFCLLGGIALALLRADASPALANRPETSPPAAWLGISVALLALSAALGFWLTLIAAGMVGIGVGGLIRELRAERVAVRAAEEGSR
jgi:hypothetical protein